MYQIDFARVAFYVVLGVLAYFGELPWWLAPAWILHDLRCQWTFRTKASRKEEEEYVKALADAQEKHVKAVVEAQAKSVQGDKWN